MSAPLHKLTDKGFLVRRSCMGACDQGHRPCVSPQTCDLPESEGAFGELLVMWVGTVTTMGLTLALVMGWI